LGLRHRLAAAVASPVEVARSIVALHSTDPASVFLSVLARHRSVTVGAVEDALYRQRSLIRLLGMRRTMFVVPRELAAAVVVACGRDMGARSRRTYLKALVESGVGDDGWLTEVMEATAKALAVRREATAGELAGDEPRLRSRVLVAEGKRYESRQAVTPWVLFLLASEGRIVRGRPLGSWTSSQWRWSPMDAWVAGGLPDLPPEVARADLVRAWLAAFGPGTVEDLRWWTGWAAVQVRQALAAVGAVEVDLDGETGLVLPGDEAPVAAPLPWVALLPALDPTPMGWSRRAWYLGEHGPVLFDSTGNVGPTVWCDGRVVGGWAQRSDGEVHYRLLEDIGSQAASAVEAEAAALTGWLGPVRLAARARRRSPLEQQLLA
jgi:hypothetical protein